MHANEVSLAGALLQRGHEQAFLETCYRDNFKPDTAIRNFFLLAHVHARRTPRNLASQTEIIYLNVDYLKKREGIQGLILIPANREKRMLVSQLSECKN